MPGMTLRRLAVCAAPKPAQPGPTVFGLTHGNPAGKPRAMIAVPALLSSFFRRCLVLPRTLHRWVALAVATLVLTSASGAFAQMRVAVVDTQRAVAETEDGLRAQATLKKLFEKRQRELDQKQKDLQKEGEDLQKNRDKLSNDVMG